MIAAYRGVGIVCEQVTGSQGFGVRPYGDGSGKTVLRRRETFYNHFDLLSVVKTDGKCTSVMSVSGMWDRKLETVVLGDDLGKLYLFEPNGDLLAEYHTGTQEINVYTSLALELKQVVIEFPYPV